MTAQTLSRLMDVAHLLHCLADVVDEEEKKSPSYLGGMIRGAERLVLFVCETIMKRGEK